METEAKDIESLAVRKTVRARKREAKPKEFIMPDLTPEDVQEALLDWIQKHPERREKE